VVVVLVLSIFPLVLILRRGKKIMTTYVNCALANEEVVAPAVLEGVVVDDVGCSDIVRG